MNASDNTPWRWANDTPCWLKPRRTVYFLTRTVNGKREDMQTPTGRLRSWKSQAAVIRALARVLEGGRP